MWRDDFEAAGIAGGTLADGAQVVLGEGRGLVLGTVGEEPVRAVLGGDEPEGAHLGQHRLAVELVAPPGHLADPPADRRSGDPLHERAVARGTRRTSALRSIGDRAHAHYFVSVRDCLTASLPEVTTAYPRLSFRKPARSR